MSWVYEAVGWLLAGVGTFNAGWDLASLATGRTTLRGGYWRDVAHHLLLAGIGLGIVRFEYDAILWPLIICLPICLIGFLVPYISMRHWSRSKHQSGGPIAEPSSACH